MKVGLLRREQVTNSDINPHKPSLLIRNETFMAKNCFPDPKLYLLQISAILNKKKDHISYFSWPLVWKMTVATPWHCGRSIYLKFRHNVSK